MSSTTVALPTPTNRTAQGPRLTHEKDALIIEYDSEGSESSAQWAEIVFIEPIYYRFSDISCCHEEDVLSAEVVRRQDESAMLTPIVSLWQEAVGWQDWQQQKGGGKRFAHFTVFFDDYGAVDVVASQCTVSLLCK